MHKKVVNREPSGGGYFSDHCAMAAPRILLWPGDHSGAHRIQHDIPRNDQPVSLFLHEPDVGASLKEMSSAAVPAIEPTGVFAVKPSHSVRQSLFRQLDYEVKVIRHQHVRSENPGESLHTDAEKIEKKLSVMIVEIDVLLCVTAARDVMQGPGIFDTKWS